MALEIELGFGPAKEPEFCSRHHRKINTGFQVVRYGIQSKGIGLLCIDCWPQARAVFDEMASEFAVSLDIDKAVQRVREQYEFHKGPGTWPGKP